MPRPTVVNAKRQPIPPLNTEELKFWLRIMEEHALFIKAGLSCDNAVLINQAETFQQELAALRVRAEQPLSERRFAELVADTRAVVEDFYRFKRRLLHMALTCQLMGCNFALFLDHVSREAEYFLLLLAKLGDNLPLYQVSSAREATFWLRLMADHAKFIFHRLDPSERTLLDTVDVFSDEFDALYLQGRDFSSMLRGEQDEVPSFRRFLQDVRVSTMRLRDFKRAAEALAAECRMLGLVPAELADHVRREADHFLLILAILEKGTYIPLEEAGDFEYLELDNIVATAPIGTVAADLTEEDDEGEEEEPVVFPPHVDDADEEDYDDDREPEPTTKSVPPVQEKAAKYKWSGKWPRPLGNS